MTLLSCQAGQTVRELQQNVISVEAEAVSVIPKSNSQ